jgi:16S rRNA (adenine1518-N6/adenine1519-N6)-dimethyltransferase
LIISLSKIQNYINKYHIYPKKRWGQNFLFDKNTIKKIIKTSGIEKDDLIVEIGTGYGSLTKELADTGKGVFSIEIDQDLKEVLKEELEEYDNIRILFADVLKISLEEELKRAFKYDKVPSYKVCANIPYNVTTPIIFYLLENCINMDSATLMMQKEVANRILALPGSKDYGLLTLMIAYHGEARFLMNVSPNCFYPKPEVESTLIQIKPYKEKRVITKDDKVFKGFLRAAFQKRRKTILNISSGYFKINKQEAKNKIESVNISPFKRPENLTIEEFALIVDTLSS